MAYTPTTWKNRLVERPRTYQMQQNADGTVTLIPSEGAITEVGTPMNAGNMNNIEQGIVNLDTGVTTLGQTVTSHMADNTRHAVSGTTDAGGTSTAYTLTPNPAITAYVKGLAIEIFMDKQNTGSSTVNISNLGAKTLKKQDGTTYASGELNINTPYRFVYNGTDFLADSSVGYYGTAGAAQTLTGYSVGTKTGIVNGTMANNGSPNYTPSSSVQNLPAGYIAGGTITAIPSTYKKYANGSVTSGSSSNITITGLGFRPSYILLKQKSNLTSSGWHGGIVILTDNPYAFYMNGIPQNVYALSSLYGASQTAYTATSVTMITSDGCNTGNILILGVPASTQFDYEAYGA